MGTDTPKEYGVPLTAVLPFLLIAVAFFAAFGPSAGIASLGAIGAGIWSQRSSTLLLTPGGAFSDAPFKERFVEWPDVTGVHRSSRFGGGLVLDTHSGRVRCPAPTSWWGGPATPEQLAEVERWWLDHRGAGPEATI